VVAFYPASGYRNNTSGAFGNIGSNGYAWSSAVSSANVYYLNFNSTVVNPINTAERAYGRAVRCVQYLLSLLRFVCSLTYCVL